MGNQSKDTVPPRSAELTEDAAAVVDRIKALTKVPKRYLIAEAICNYLPWKYEGQELEE